MFHLYRGNDSGDETRDQDPQENEKSNDMTIDELIAALTEIKENNREPKIPNFDPGTMEVQVQSEDGTYDSDIVSVEEANGPWIIVNEPNYDL